ncbi:Accessory secretory protein Asp3 [Staphylococcus petrasii]|uniref:Accessory secretory protein Asp3 n=2 Tax=Staphylococcus petrasii TaxID=1276936 RepID=A0A380FXR9_9STAP|nr:accessory Sec system protein Asp3 [Staphylococcus petrasii]PNZ30794.1 accessory Sec system protein Asp3 [Staphylococcus petrasii]TGE10836.1 accessory Sec system protein Asp3 [Staphylococcus petrasii]SUM42788.1 Accessory secretory protein Asp3 [Staphylococcus petrasii]
MPMQNDFKIEWRHINVNTFMYGTKLQFKEDETYFENPLMPSGTVIHDWHMVTDFNRDKVVPSLPVLKRGHHYVLTLNYEVEPPGSAYFKMTFYRKNDTELSYLIIKEDMSEFQFPAEAYAYKLELINAGLSVLHFQNIKIKELSVNNEEITDYTGSNLEVVNSVISMARGRIGGGADG